jgi:hypothetical protein
MVAPVISNAPSQSTPRRRPGAGDSSIRTRPSRNAAAPIGRLMKKIQCQLSASVSEPPASRPIEPPLETMKV